MRKLIFVTILWVLMAHLNILTAQISPGDLSQPHAYLEGVENCTKCHDAGKKSVSDVKCLSCHSEIGASMKSGRGYHASSEVKSKRCYSCHNEHHGRKFDLTRIDSLKFNHNLTGFKLQGAHAKESCKSCHNPKFTKLAKFKKKINTYFGLDTNCTSCHTDFHQGKMGNDCASCHNMNNFKNPQPFNHNKTRFPLVGKHKNLSCDECHKTVQIKGEKVQQYSNMKFANCNACHKDPHQNKFGQDCKSCHVETSFSTVKNKDSFDHDKTNYKLVGKHKNVDCNACHTSGNYTKALNHDKCTDCHQDHHRGQLDKNGQKPDCASCHDVNGFTPSDYSIEDHEQTDFPLKGAHTATACFECHVKKDEWVFKNMGKYCVDCHTNVHKETIGRDQMPGDDCTICHVQDSWKKVSYNHDLTGYKLQGKHAQLSCNECHYRKDKNGLVVQKFKGTDTECSACHTDNHQHQFDIDGKTDCLRCHDYEKWNPPTFNHDKARFKLDGDHAGLDCVACHKEISTPAGKFIQHRFEDISCASCHQK